jgi:4-amino-4-deoxy-L-arabinose transferase-like glycosyltransferase
MSKAAVHVVLLLAMAGSVFFINLGGAKLWDRDEPRNARCTVEMLQRGDWVTPQFNGELRTHKPILTYWLMMTAYSLFGVNEFAARFWSAALGLGTTLATYAIGRRLFCAEVGFWAALAMATSTMFCIASRAATPDAVLIFCSVMAILVYVVGTFRAKQNHDDPLEPPQPRTPGRFFPKSWAASALMYAWMGLAVLAKGPVGLVLPTAVIGMFLLIMRLTKSQAHSAEGVTHRSGPGPKSGDFGYRPAPRWNFLQWSLLAAAFVGLLAIDWLISPLAALAAAVVPLAAWAAWKPQSSAWRLLRPFAPRHFLATCWQMRPLTALAVVLVVAGPWYVWVGLRTDGAWLSGFFLEHNLARATESFEGHRGTLLYYPASSLAGFFPWSIVLIPAVVALVRRIRHGDSWSTGYVFAACWIGVYMALFSLAKTKLPSYITPGYPGLALVLGALVFHWRRGSAFAGPLWPRVGFGMLLAAGVALLIGLPIAARQFLPGEEWLGLIGLAPLVAGGCGWWFSRARRPVWAVRSLAACALLLMTLAFGVAAVRVSRHQQIGQLLASAAQASERAKIAGHRAHEPSWVFYWGQPIPAIANKSPAAAAEFLQEPDAFLLTTDRALKDLQRHLPGDVTVIARGRKFLDDHDLIMLGRDSAGVRAASARANEALR